MDFFDVLRARRSVRLFLPQAPDEQLVHQVLEAGTCAPTAGNMQPWEFIIVRNDQALREDIVGTTFIGSSRDDGPPQRWLLGAPVFVVVCCNVKRSAARYGWEAARKLSCQDVSAAIENMLLAATALGLASCWVSGMNVSALMSVLGLPRHVEPVAILPLGYAAKVPPPPPRLGLEELVRGSY